MLQHALSAMLVEGLRDPRIGLVTVTEVRMSDDLRSARIFVSAFGDDEARGRSMQGLKAAASFLRRRVTETLDLRFAPMLYFVDDDTMRKAERLHSLLHLANEGVPEPAAVLDEAAQQPGPKVFVERSEQPTLAGPARPDEGPPPTPKPTTPTTPAGRDVRGRRRVKTFRQHLRRSGRARPR
jgi:ribosome-binding factor A